MVFHADRRWLVSDMIALNNCSFTTISEYLASVKAFVSEEHLV